MEVCRYLLAAPLHCRAEAHCGYCRDPANADFRRSFAPLLGLTGDAWECPFGKPMGYAPPGRTDRAKLCHGCSCAMQRGERGLVPQTAGEVAGCALAQCGRSYEPTTAAWRKLRRCPHELPRWTEADLYGSSWPGPAPVNQMAPSPPAPAKLPSPPASRRAIRRPRPPVDPNQAARPVAPPGAPPQQPRRNRGVDRRPARILPPPQP